MPESEPIPPPTDHAPEGASTADRAKDVFRKLGPAGLLGAAWSTLPALNAIFLYTYISSIGQWLRGHEGQGLVIYAVGFALLAGAGLVPTYAAAILGGIGNAYGALAGGIVIGLSQEWATLFVNPRWKPAVGFAILILTLLVLPRGIFGRKRARA